MRLCGGKKNTRTFSINLKCPIFSSFIPTVSDFCIKKDLQCKMLEILSGPMNHIAWQKSGFHWSHSSSDQKAYLTKLIGWLYLNIFDRFSYLNYCTVYFLGVTKKFSHSLSIHIQYFWRFDFIVWELFALILPLFLSWLLLPWRDKKKLNLKNLW